ncbi:hypothetical protein [Terrarubrum flagellatum]|uniref:hypothetical protein n=1 Tax=Terrirubrum flagellatum TaxID=2895980 RepID=UPI0031454887
MNSHVNPTGFNPGRGLAGAGSERREGSLATGDVWSAFAGARTAHEFCRSWLALQCGMIPGAVAALLLLEEENGRYAAAAAWPDPARDMAYLAPAAEQALAERRGVARKADASKTDAGKPDTARPETSRASRTPAPAASHLAYPIDVGGRLYGVVAVDMGASSPAALQAALRQLLWGVGWLEAMFRRRQNEEDRARPGSTAPPSPWTSSQARASSAPSRPRRSTSPTSLPPGSIADASPSASRARTRSGSPLSPIPP